MSQEELNKMAMAAQPVFERLKKIFYAFGVSIQPIVQVIGKLVDLFMALGDKTSFSINGIRVNWIALFTVGVAGWLLLTKVIGKFSMGATVAGKIGKEISDNLSKLGDKAAGLGDKLTNLSKAQDIAGKTAKSGAISMIAFGAGILLVGAGIGLAAFGVAQLAKAMKDLSGGAIVGLVLTIGILVVGIVALGFAMQAASPGALMFGFAMLMIGGAIALAAYGISKLVDSFTRMFTAISGSAGIVPILTALGKTMGILGFISVAAAFSMPALAISLGILALAFAAMGTSGVAALQALASLFSSLSKMSGGTGAVIRGVAGEIKSMIASIDKIPLEKALAFAVITQAVTGPNTGAGGDGGGAAAGTAGGGNVLTAAAGGGIIRNNITINLDGRVLKRFVIDTINEEFRPKT
jgi:hypothetical protein